VRAPTSLAAFAALILAAGMTGPARADQVHFTGDTSADATVIRDALQNVLRVAAVSEHCSTMSAVQSSLLPQDYRPPQGYDAAPATAHYERWDVTLCGRVVPFLLGFWTPAEGGTMFQIGYPYPADEASAAARH
jgi:hypothetical protein